MQALGRLRHYSDRCERSRRFRPGLSASYKMKIGSIEQFFKMQVNFINQCQPNTLNKQANTHRKRLAPVPVSPVVSSAHTVQKSEWLPFVLKFNCQSHFSAAVNTFHKEQIPASACPTETPVDLASRFITRMKQ